MANYLNTGKKQYTEAEKKAFHMGRAFATAKAGKRVKLPDNEKIKQSFKNGVNKVRSGKLSGGKKSTQTTCANCGSPLYVVDGNGVIVKVLDGGKAK